MRAASLTVAAMLLLVPALAEARRTPDPSTALAGRVAGRPVSCITTSRADNDAQTFDNHEILFRTSGGAWYLNHLPNCPTLNSDRGYVSRQYSGQMCSGDIITVIDPPSPADLGNCVLGEFTPYAKPRR